MFQQLSCLPKCPCELTEVGWFHFQTSRTTGPKIWKFKVRETALYNIIMILWRVCLLTLLKSALRICSPQAYRNPNPLWLRAAVPRTALPTCLSRSRQFILHCMTSNTWYWQEKARWDAKPKPGMGTSEEASTFFKKGSYTNTQSVDACALNQKVFCGGGNAAQTSLRPEIQIQFLASSTHQAISMRIPK